MDHCCGGRVPPAREWPVLNIGAGRWHTLDFEVSGKCVTSFVNGLKAGEKTHAKGMLRQLSLHVQRG